MESSSSNIRIDVHRDLFVAIHGEELGSLFASRMTQLFEEEERQKRQGVYRSPIQEQTPKKILPPPFPDFLRPLAVDPKPNEDTTINNDDDVPPPASADVSAPSFDPPSCFSFSDKATSFPPAELIKKLDRRSASFKIARPFTCCCESGGFKQRYTCIWSGAVHSFTDMLTGFTWVAVHGMNSVCVATTTKDLDRELNLRLCSFDYEPDLSLRHFTDGLIGEVEGFVDHDAFPRHNLHLIIKKPFGVVSLAPDTKIVGTASSGDEALNAEYDEENAIKFLQDEIESGAVFTYNKTVETAICALNPLFRKEFKASDIVVFVLKKKDGGEAKALTTDEIQEHLAALNNNQDICVREDIEKEEILEIEEEEKLDAKKNHLLGPSLHEFRCRAQKKMEEGKKLTCRPICLVHHKPPSFTLLAPNY